LCQVLSYFARDKDMPEAALPALAAQAALASLVATLLTPVAAAGQDIGECGGTITAASGRLEFRREGGIPRGLWCNWYFTHPGVTGFRFSFESNELGRGCRQVLLFSDGGQFEKELASPAKSERSVVCREKSKKKKKVKAWPAVEVKGSEVAVSLVAVSAPEAATDGFTLNFEAIEGPTTPTTPITTTPITTTPATTPTTTPITCTPATCTPATTPTTTPSGPAACRSLPESCLGRAKCDVTTPGGPWVVLQSRTVGDVLFNNCWDAYRQGFGSLDGDHWLGLDALYTLCPTSRPCELLVELTYPGDPARVPRQPSGRYVALYGRFAVAGPQEFYRLDIAEFDTEASTAGPGMTYRIDLSLHGANFSTWDQDHDGRRYTAGGASCSLDHRASQGWWFNRVCGAASLNGEWGAGDAKGLRWFPVTGFDSATSSRMLVRVGA